jgi:hypothetical protein
MAASAPNPFHEHMPRQALALAGWVLFWTALEAALRGLGLDGRRQMALFLALLAGIGLAGRLAAPAWMFNLLTSVRFAVTQGAGLSAAVLLAMAAGPALLDTLAFRALLALLAVSMLAVTWKRRPYDLARTGFLLVHTAPALALLGMLSGRGRLVQAGCLLFFIGCAWMFYLKPVLKRREARP